MQSPKRVLGIEGGGTKTEWVQEVPEGDGWRVEAGGRLPASNLRLTTDEALRTLFRELPGDVDAVGVCLAGCATEDDRSRLQGLVQERWPGIPAWVGSDRDSAMAAAFGDGDGIAVIAGTGAAVHGRAGGRVEKAGGWGQLLGDLGGGYHIAMQGLRKVLNLYDLHQRITPLAETILRTLGLNRLQDLVQWVMQADKMSVARLAPCIFAAAREGEAEMLQVLQADAGVLAEYTHAVAVRLGVTAPQVRLFGGLFAHHPDYRALYSYRLSVLLPKATVAICTEPGARGAAWLASRFAVSFISANPTGPLDRAVALSAAAADGGAAGAREALERELAGAATEQSNPRSERLDELSTSEFVALFVTEEEMVARALQAAQEPLGRALDVAAAALQGGGRLFYVGAGTSGRLGVLDASEIPPTFGMPPERVQGIMAGGAAALQGAVEGAEDHPEAGALAVKERGVRSGDVVCGITASGRTPFVLGALAKARENGARTILLSCNPARVRSGAEWDVEVDLPTGPELVTGSTRLKAGTATKVALNLISTGAMVRLGRVRGNTMADLGVSNQKLQERAVRSLVAAMSVSAQEARARLEAAGWNLRACLP